MNQLISIRNLRKNRQEGSNEAYSLFVPSFDVVRGEKILVTGPSGSGKSTLLDMLGMALRPDAADRFLFRPQARRNAGNVAQNTGERQDSSTDASVENSAPIPRHDIALAWTQGQTENLASWRRHVGYVLQTGGLLPFLTVRENILSQHKLLGLPHDGMAEKLAAILGITKHLNKLPAELSVGERQRAAIARALASSPPLVLADEPTAALDPANAMGVLHLFAQAVSELGSTLILVSHAPEQMRGMGFRELSVELEPAGTGDLTGTLAVLRDKEATCGSRPDAGSEPKRHPGHNPENDPKGRC